MAEPPRFPKTEEDAGLGRERRTAGGTPRWVFVVGLVIAIALVGLMVFLHLSGTLGPGTH